MTYGQRSSASREETFRAFAGEADVLEQALDLSLQVTLGNRLALDHTFLRALLVSRAVGSLRCGWLSAVAGYRTQALTLTRSAFEDYATAVWVAKRPKDAKLWLSQIVDDVPQPERRPPRPTKMFDELDEEGDSSGVFRKAYGFLSEAAHPRASGLLWNARFDRGDEGAKHSAELLPVYDESATATCLHYLLLVAYRIRAVAVELRVSSVPDDEEATKSLLAESERVAAAILDAVSKIRPFVPMTGDPESE